MKLTQLQEHKRIEKLDILLFNYMLDTSKKSPMELINEVPPIKVEGRIVACEGDSNPALGHPIEFICLDLNEPAICKYCGLRYVQEHHH
uniref:Zinc finger CHCC-type domain-containing protein n=1 Tax=Fagus sylvatica TaxID=28930 RepID=A0A2N9FAU3_FAGSY